MNNVPVLLLIVVLAVFFARPVVAANYEIKKVDEGVYAAIALPEGKAASNALIIITPYQVLLAGAHFVPEAIRELTVSIADITPLPLRYVILTHHHKGYNYIDFDFPANVEIITSWQTWQALKSESRQLRNHVTFFDKGLTLIRGDLAIVLNNTEFGHSEGDVFVYLPNEGIIFTSDLFYNDLVGYMGEGRMRDWVITLEALEAVGARYVVPGLGQVSDRSGLRRFRLFFKDFLTEVLRNIEAGRSLEETKKNFSLPSYENLPGYKAFFSVNVERAYWNLKGEE
ncbi:MAG: MBL fold metallo-hydrolase [Desulfuromonadales bacterium]|nr:MAG: MBL fold metallo-hydrolase [Desulfuromonadales bacterium]